MRLIPSTAAVPRSRSSFLCRTICTVLSQSLKSLLERIASSAIRLLARFIREVNWSFSISPSVKLSTSRSSVCCSLSQAEAGCFAGRRGGRKTRSVPWLVASLAKAHGGDQNAEELIKAAATIAPESPAFAMASYHRSRLLRESGHADEARVTLDKVLPQLSSGPSTINALLSERMQVAASFEEFLKYAPRHPVNVGMMGLDSETPYCEKEKECQQLVYGDKFKAVTQFSHFDRGGDQTKKTQAMRRFDSDGARIFDKRLPLELLVQATGGDQLPTHLRAEIALAGWSRAVILGDAVSAKEIGQKLNKSFPALAPYVAAYEKETTADGQKFAGVFAILHFPGMRPYVNASSERETPLEKIDSYRDNWWCSDVGAAIEVPNIKRTVGMAILPTTPNRMIRTRDFRSPHFLRLSRSRLLENSGSGCHRLGPGPII